MKSNRIRILFVLLIIGFFLISINDLSLLTHNRLSNQNNKEIKDKQPQQSGVKQLWANFTNDEVKAVAISSDGNYIVAGTKGDRKVWLFEKSSSNALWSYTTNDEVYTVAISSDGQYIVAGGKDNYVYLFDKSSSNPLWSDNIGSEVLTVGISSDGNYIVAGNARGYLYFYHKSSENYLWRDELGEDQNVYSVAISSDGNYIVAGSRNNRVYFWKSSSSTPEWSYSTGGDVKTVDISSDGKYIVAGSNDHYVYLFNKESSTPQWQKDITQNVVSVAISSDGEYLVAGGGSLLYLFNQSSSNEMWSRSVGNVNSVAISANGDYIVSGDASDEIYLFNKSSSTEMWSKSASDQIFSVDISSDGRYFVAGSKDNNVYLFRQIFPVGAFSLTSNAGNPDKNGMFTLSWNESLWAENYSVYTHDNYITEINGTVTTLSEGLTNNSYTISGKTDGDYYYAVVAVNEDYNSTSNCVKITVQFPPYNAKFDVIENASSNKLETGFQAIEDNYFNVSTPDMWNAESWQLNASTYSKEQIVQDSVFEVPESSSPWSASDKESGNGHFYNYWQPDPDNPEYVRTSLYYTGSQIAFKEHDSSYWEQDISNINPDSLEIHKGKIFQEENETTLKWDFTIDPDFTQDLECPYGGEYNPPYDVINLNYENNEYLLVDISPDDGASGRNPSASWNHYIDLPYEVDYAQITISWEIDSSSSFEAFDKYQVSARINEEYISGSNLIIKDDSLPYTGSDEALIIYDNSSHLDHGIIKRTYNITDLLDKRMGNNTFDFGVWSKNPTHLGDNDQIIAKFHSIEILYNTSDKYEVASLEFDYKCIDHNNYGYNKFTKNKIASLYLILGNDLSNEEYIRIIDCSQMNINDSDEEPVDYTHISFSLSQEYLDFLDSDNLGFKIGVLFEDDLYGRIYYRLYFDNVNFSINYKHTNVTFSGLENNIDNMGWNYMDDFSLNVDTSSWSEGETHNIQFRSNQSKYENNLYLNFDSELKINSTMGVSNGAYAIYEIESVDSEYGLWNITYDNRDSYYRLESTPDFDISTYSIAFINLPAFDSKRSNSSNWNIFNAISPNFLNVSQNNLIRFNYSSDLKNQSAKIENAFGVGDWTLQALQLNYITNCTFNTTEDYLGIPSYFIAQSLEYNFTLIEENPITGNYSLIVYNSSYGVMDIFPQYFNSSETEIIGNIFLSGSYDLGQYYLSIEWNDTATVANRTLRFGSIITSFYILNNTQAQLYESTTSVQVGDNATFKLYYRTLLGNFSIAGAIITVYDNTTGTPVLWGTPWTGESQASVTPLTEGNHSIDLGTDGASQGTYKILFKCEKVLHKTQYLTFDIDITTVPTTLVVNITIGAYYSISQWVINDDNIPYVNDSTNSVLQLNLTDSSSGVGQTGGLIIAKIGIIGGFFEAIDIGGGLYNLTLDTTGCDATPEGGNITLYIICTADGYNSTELNVIIKIAKIPTQLELQNINPVYAEGQISICAIMENIDDPGSPKPNNHGNLTYYIHQGGAPNLTGTMEFKMGGFYIRDIMLTGLSAGTYYIYINGTAHNCNNSQSNEVQFAIIPQNETQLEIIIVPETIRILQ